MRGSANGRVLVLRCFEFFFMNDSALVWVNVIMGQWGVMSLQV